MRVIGGRLRGLRLNPPAKLPVRPTTDLAKEALFNILINQIDPEQIRVLDLFSGTGNISIEFASRGAPLIVSVDRDHGCFTYLKTIASQHRLQAIRPVKADVFKFMKHDNEQYDLIFADPPYNMPQLNKIAPEVFRYKLLRTGGVLIIEHPSLKKLDNDPHFTEQRIYGSSAFSFFRYPDT
jgi:16S rRNA (guanine966-N2)-methyltransferase